MVEVNDDGEVTGMEEALNKLVGRFPYLADEPPDEPKVESHGPRSTTGMGPMNRDKKSNTIDRARIEKRFPALRRGRR